MGSLLKRANKKFFPQASVERGVTEYPAVDWIINPTMTNVEIDPLVPGVYHPKKYWDVTGADIVLLDAAGQSAADAAETAATQAANAAKKQAIIDSGMNLADPWNNAEFEGSPLTDADKLRILFRKVLKEF